MLESAGTTPQDVEGFLSAGTCPPPDTAGLFIILAHKNSVMLMCRWCNTKQRIYSCWHTWLSCNSFCW